MTDGDAGYWGLRAWLRYLIKIHCALGQDFSLHISLRWKCCYISVDLLLYLPRLSILRSHPGCAWWLQPSLKACDIEHNRDQIQLRSANKQQTWALPVTISASLLCQSLYKQRCWTMKELRCLLMWDCQLHPNSELREREWIYQHLQFLVSSCTFHRGHKGLLPVYHHAGLSCSWGLTKPVQAARRIRYERITDIHPVAKILEDLKRVWHSEGK